MFAVRGLLKLRCFLVFLRLLLESLEVGSAEGFSVKRCEGVVTKNSSDLHSFQK